MRTLLPIHFRLGVLVLSASCAGSSRGAKHLEFTQILLQDSAPPDYSGSTNPAASCWEFLCDRRDSDLPAGCQRHSGTADTPSKCPLSCSSSTEIIQTGHSSHRTSLTKGALVKKQLLSLLSPKYKLWHDWAAPSTPSNIPAALPELAGSGPRPQQAAGALPASPELAGAGTCSKLGARLQWHLTNDPMPGAPLLFPGRYPDWQGARNLKNRCLGLLCCCVFNGFGQERDEKAGPEAGLQPSLRSSRAAHKGRPRPSWARPRQTGSHPVNGRGNSAARPSTALTSFQKTLVYYLPY